MSMNPWKPDACPKQGRRVGKTAEEVNELGCVLARISIQGIDEIDPASGKTNRQRFYEEMADVLAQINCNIDHFGVPEWFYERVTKKIEQMGEWEAHFNVPQ